MKRSFDVILYSRGPSSPMAGIGLFGCHMENIWESARVKTEGFARQTRTIRRYGSNTKKEEKKLLSLLSETTPPALLFLLLLHLSPVVEVVRQDQDEPGDVNLLLSPLTLAFEKVGTPFSLP
ncbi:hypothetical protein EYF80_006946 [Liparis tanakae]|uniref:Uncharacterized protein n=1 Tax=Liparis tanakae TaxID=230148 RepID=A0A4Z2IXJ7_9TELE|nr:hypothetical protein EYF80_006946 [Liparis tanakae]